MLAGCCREILMKYEVWCEGYRIMSGYSDANFLGACDAENFSEACHKVLRRRGMDDFNFNPERLTYWGCKLFDNEKDARETFG